MTLSIPGVMDASYGAGATNISVSRAIDDRQMSQLPVVNQPWPPPEYDPVSYMHRVWDAWWTGDRQRLAWVYYNLGANSPVGRSYFSTTGEAGLPGPRPGQFRGGLLGSIEYSFWGQPTPPGEKRTRTHVPVAGDLAATSASILFGKPPVIRSSLDGKAGALNNAWFDTLLDDHFHRRLLDAGELAAAHGGVYLRAVWDTEVQAKPWLVSVPADVGVPFFTYDKLKAATFWQVLADNGDDVLRHLEMHVPSQNAIYHGLYHGNQTDLGERIPMDAHEVTKRIASDPRVVGGTITFPNQPLNASSVVYVPNLTPNRIFRDLGPQAWPIGRSDYQGVENLMDNLDEVYSSWMRDVRLAKSRIIVPPEYLDNIGRGRGAVWEPDREVLSPLSMLHDDGGANQIVLSQFAIRFQEHQATCEDLIRRIVNDAGYSSLTFGDYESGSGSAMTATEVNMRERKTLTTRSRKITNWRPALADAIYSLMVIERQNFGNTLITPERPNIEFVETSGADITVLAETALALENAGAASKQVLVQLVHPDWSPEQVNEEVTRIFAETGATLAARARVEIDAPPGASFADEISQLANPQPVAPVTGGVPGDGPNEPSTGGADPTV